MFIPHALQFLSGKSPFLGALQVGNIHATPDIPGKGAVMDSRNCSAGSASRGDVCNGTGISILGSRAELSIHPFATY